LLGGLWQQTVSANAHGCGLYLNIDYLIYSSRMMKNLNALFLCFFAIAAQGSQIEPLCQGQSQVESPGLLASGVLKLKNGNILIRDLAGNFSVFNRDCALLKASPQAYGSSSSAAVELSNGTVFLSDDSTLSATHVISDEGQSVAEAKAYKTETPLILPNHDLFTISGDAKAIIFSPTLEIKSEQALSVAFLPADTLLPSSHPILLKDGKTIFATLNRNPAGLFRSYDLVIEAMWFNLEGKLIRRARYKTDEGTKGTPVELANGNIVISTWSAVLTVDPQGKIISKTPTYGTNSGLYVQKDGSGVLAGSTGILFFGADGIYRKTVAFRAAESVCGLSDGSLVSLDLYGTYRFFDSGGNLTGSVSVGFNRKPLACPIEVSGNRFIVSSEERTRLEVYSRNTFKVVDEFALRKEETAIQGFVDESQALTTFVTNQGRLLKLRVQ
jgi:hypothetical protein